MEINTIYNKNSVFFRLNTQMKLNTRQHRKSNNQKYLDNESYWNDYLENQQNETLIKIIDKISSNHLNYHQESAKLYINRATIFYKLGKIDLAKNDLVKAHNLDRNLAQKNYSIYNILLSKLTSGREFK